MAVLQQTVASNIIPNAQVLCPHIEATFPSKELFKEYATYDLNADKDVSEAQAEKQEHPFVTYYCYCRAENSDFGLGSSWGLESDLCY